MTVLPRNPRSVGQEAKPRSAAWTQAGSSSGKARWRRHGVAGTAVAVRPLGATSACGQHFPLGPTWSAPWRPVQEPRGVGEPAWFGDQGDAAGRPRDPARGRPPRLCAPGRACVWVEGSPSSPPVRCGGDTAAVNSQDARGKGHADRGARGGSDLEKYPLKTRRRSP